MMNRLTVKNMHGFGVLRNPAICLRCGEADYGPTTEAGERVAERLQAYEDAAPLEEVQELVKAKKLAMEYHDGKNCFTCGWSGVNSLKTYGVWRCDYHGFCSGGRIPENIHCEEWRNPTSEEAEADLDARKEGK